MTPADLAAVVADWCEAHGVGRVDLAIALLGAEVERSITQPFNRARGHDHNGSADCADGPRRLWAKAATVDWAEGEVASVRPLKTYARAAALAVAAMRCDLEGR